MTQKSAKYFSSAESTLNPIIYCDMDGVLVDFHGGLLNYLNSRLNIFDSLDNTEKYYIISALKSLNRNQFIKQDMHMHSTTRNMIKLVRYLTCNNIMFWKNLSWTKYGVKLYQFIKNHNYKFLTHATSKESQIGKIDWLISNFNMTKRKAKSLTIFEKNKYRYASSSAILIDDTPENVIKFQSHGGLAILHLNIKQTIRDLEYLLRYLG